MDSPVKPELVVQGVSASNGIAYGPILIYQQTELEIPRYQVDADKRAAEISRFEHAIVVTRKQIAKVQDEVEKNLGPEEAKIFDAHLLVLEDQALIVESIREFETTGLNIETCFNNVAQRYIQAFDEIDDEYLRERAADIRDVVKRLLQNLMGKAGSSLSRVAGQRIVVANDISPSDSAVLNKSQVLALVTDAGSKTSHAVIVARSMKVPAVVGARSLVKTAKNGDMALVDGFDGLVIINPSEQTLFRYGKIQEEKRGFEERVMATSQLPSQTLDGSHVTLMANIDKMDEVLLAKNHLAEGVGLFRTEFLFMHALRLPSEDEQFNSYRTIVEVFAPEAVTIRTLDIGGDKLMPGNPALGGNEANPFMGLRAIRFCLQHPAFFKEQLRAILRASAFGKVKLMYPMISGPDELEQANVLLDEARAELRTKGQAFDEKMEIGSMIEIPSAAATADILAKKCDFFSIGTNDLIQYLLAIDRVNERIAHLYEPTHPAVLRTLKGIIDDAHRQKIKVSICGEMAGDPIYVPLLLGLGADELSMTPMVLPSVKFLIRNMKMSEAKKLARDVLEMGNTKAAYAAVEKFYKERIG